MNTFVVRIYRCEAESEDGVVGRIEHVESGEHYVFRQATEVVRVIQAQSASVDVAGEGPESGDD